MPLAADLPFILVNVGKEESRLARLGRWDSEVHSRTNHQPKFCTALWWRPVTEAANSSRACFLGRARPGTIKNAILTVMYHSESVWMHQWQQDREHSPEKRGQNMAWKEDGSLAPWEEAGSPVHLCMTSRESDRRRDRGEGAETPTGEQPMQSIRPRPTGRGHA